MVSAIVEVCQHLGIEKAHFVAHSMGTIVCQHLAVQHPEMVSRFALSGPLVSPPGAGRPAILARSEKAASGGAEAIQCGFDQGLDLPSFEKKSEALS
jgi:pimeloyl-ACP methyl ester carboxylesterase